MDRRERAGDLGSSVLAALQGLQAGIWTALPGIIHGIDFGKQSCIVQPSLKAKAQNPDGSFEWVILPLLVDCPLFWPSGGGCTLTFPVTRGDECLVVFSSRCIDAWWQSGGVQQQMEFRMHDLSDGFAFVGFSSNPRVIPAVSATKAQLRNDAGTTLVGIDPEGTVQVLAESAVTVNAPAIVATASGSISLTAPIVQVNGDLLLNGNLAFIGGGGSTAAVKNLAVTGTLTNNGVDVGSSHKHSGVQTGGGNTGNPI